MTVSSFAADAVGIMLFCAPPYHHHLSSAWDCCWWMKKWIFSKVWDNFFFFLTLQSVYYWNLKTLFSGLPWWRSGWESACQCRGHGFEPWSGKIPHAVEQLGPWATITEPASLEPVLHKRGCDNERPTHRDEEWPLLAMKSGPHLPQLEKALSQKRRPNTAINK